MMLGGHTANAKKASSKFEDSDSRMSRSRAVSELPQRPSPRLKASAAASEGSGGVTRRHAGVRGTAPRSPLHEKKPADAGTGAGAGAGSRVAELEAKLGKAHGQLTEMREQLAAAEKARKEARAALVEAKRHFAAKRRDDDVATSAVEGDDHNNKVMVAAPEDRKGSTVSSGADVLDAFVPTERENDEEAKNTIYDGEVVGNAMTEGDGKKGSHQEVDDELMAKDVEVDEMRAKLMAKDVELEELRAKLMAMDVEVYELRAKLMVRDTEVDELRKTLMANNTELDELRGKLASNDAEVNRLTASLMAKDADIAALEADNADLTKMAEEASEAVQATAARARETEHALRESAAREARVAELLRVSERAREAMEAEAQRSRVQSEQWRKAAEEAAVVLGGVVRATAGAPGGATGTPRADKRCHGWAGSGVWTTKSPEEDCAGGKRKPGAMRVLSDLWKKKAQK